MEDSGFKYPRGEAGGVGTFPKDNLIISGGIMSEGLLRKMEELLLIKVELLREFLGLIILEREQLRGGNIEGLLPLAQEKQLTLVALTKTDEEMTATKRTVDQEPEGQSADRRRLKDLSGTVVNLRVEIDKEIEENRALIGESRQLCREIRRELVSRAMSVNAYGPGGRMEARCPSLICRRMA